MDPSDKIGGRFAITGSLGAGGMGEVYRARDERLGREVALKVLPEGLATDAGRLARFELEARAVAALNHPNILALHDLGYHQGAPYLVTELLDGQSLRSRLAGGPLPVSVAVELALQLARGLAAAHAKGIVHRDLKPENVFVTADGTLKILDFGLASLRSTPDGGAGLDEAPTETRLTQAGMVLGTVGYMAPEQVRGQRVDPRADVFSFGCVLYEMLTGRRAFARDTAADTMAAILQEEPPLESATSASPRLAPVLRCCLAKRPEDRFSLAHDLALALQAAVSGADATPGVVPVALPRLQRRRRRMAVALVAALVAVGILSTAVLVSRQRVGSTGAGLDARRVVVIPFENRTGVSQSDVVGLMAADWISRGLAQVEELKVVPLSEVLHTAQKLREQGGAPGPRAVAGAMAAGTVVTGAYYRRGAALELSAEVTAVADGTLLQAFEPVASSFDDPTPAVEKVRQQVVGVLAFRDSPMAGYSRPPSFDAYREFTTGLGFTVVDDAKALECFRRALALDSGFVAARVQIAAALTRLGQRQAALAQIDELDKERQRLGRFEQLELDAGRAFIERRYADALLPQRELVSIAPRMAPANLALGISLFRLNRPREALEVLDTMPDLPFGNHPLSTYHLRLRAQSLHALGEHRKELALVRAAKGRYPQEVQLAELEMSALAALGDVAELERIADRTLASPARRERVASAVEAVALELRAHGHADAARRVATRLVTWLEGAPAGDGESDQRPILATALVVAGRPAEARPLLLKLVEDEPDAIDLLGRLGALEAWLGDARAASRIASRLADIKQPLLFGEPSYWRACIAAQLHDPEGAIGLLRRAYAERYPYDPSLHTELDLEPLRGEASFQELVEPKG